MARLWSSGFELNSTDTNIEFNNVFQATISGATKRSGGYSGSVSIANTSEYRFRTDINGTSGPLFIRMYLRVFTKPGSNSAIISVDDTVWITLNATGNLELHDEDGQIGSDSSILATDGTWYRVELKVDGSGAGGSHEVTGRLDGTNFASSTTRDLSDTSWGVLDFGGNLVSGHTSSSGVWLIDDLAINDNTGSNQTSWPGDGKIVHMQPNAAGDNNDASSGDYSDVDEVSPDGATTIAVMATNNDILDVNMESSSSAGIGSGDTVTLVQVGVNGALDSAGTVDYKTRVKSASGGTLQESAEVNPVSVAYYSNTYAISGTPSTYPLTSYTDPTTASAWTPTGTNSLDNMQIGIQVTDALPDYNVSTLWALVEYTEGGTTTSTSSTSSSTSSTSSSTSTSSTSTSTTQSTSTSTSTSSTSTSTSLSTSTSSTSTSQSTSTSTSTTVSFTTSTSSTSTSTTTSQSTSTTQSTSTSTSTSSTSTSTTQSTSTSTSTSSTSSSTSTTVSTSTSSTSSSTSTSQSTSTSTSTSSTSTSTSSTTTLPLDSVSIPVIKLRKHTLNASVQDGETATMEDTGVTMESDTILMGGPTTPDITTPKIKNIRMRAK